MQKRCPGAPGARYCLQWGQTSPAATGPTAVGARAGGGGAGRVGIGACVGGGGAGVSCLLPLDSSAYGIANRSPRIAKSGKNTAAKGAFFSDCVVPVAGVFRAPDPSTPATGYS